MRYAMVDGLSDVRCAMVDGSSDVRCAMVDVRLRVSRFAMYDGRLPSDRRPLCNLSDPDPKIFQPGAPDRSDMKNWFLVNPTRP